MSNDHPPLTVATFHHYSDWNMIERKFWPQPLTWNTASEGKILPLKIPKHISKKNSNPPKLFLHQQRNGRIKNINY